MGSSRLLVSLTCVCFSGGTFVLVFNPQKSYLRHPGQGVNAAQNACIWCCRAGRGSWMMFTTPPSRTEVVGVSEVKQSLLKF